MIEAKKPVTTYNILVVEDEIPLQRAVVRMLEDKGFDVVTSRTVEQALQLLTDIKIDVIWLDHYLLGDLDGIDLLIKLKQNPVWANLPVFVVSNTASDDKVRNYIRLGVAKYIVKSNFSLREIVGDIVAYMQENTTPE